MRKNSDVGYMQLALELAARANEATYPNPMVGAVIVKGAKIIGKGFHHYAGGNHAEIEAIKNAASVCSGATMFVTLEPCDHFGKTPPCTDAIIESGIKEIRIAMKDPNPINNGSGIKRLRKAGIDVKVGLSQDEAKFLNRKYIKFITTKLPYVTIKLAESLDGRIASADSSSKWISSDLSRKFVKKMRRYYDGILVGANTVLRDNPSLLASGSELGKLNHVVVDSRLRIPIASNLIKNAAKIPLIIGTTELAPARRIKEFSKIKGVEIIPLKTKNGMLPLEIFFAKLAQKGILNVLCEGGARLAGSLFDEGLVDEVIFFIAPKIIGGGPYVSISGKGARHITKAVELDEVEVKRFGKDIMIRGVVQKSCLRV